MGKNIDREKISNKGNNMKKIIVILMMLGVSAFGACEIEDWGYSDSANSIKVHGSTTCMSGRITIKAYDGNDNYIGNNFTYIRGGAFTVYIDGHAPSNLKIKYSVTER